jgi:hypothetical protein
LGTRLLPLSFAALIAAGVLCSGCGGSDDSAAEAAPKRASEVELPSKAELAFTVRANEICAARERTIDDEARTIHYEASEGRKPKSADTAENSVRSVIVPNFEAELEELEALQRPPESKIPVEKIFASIQQVIDEAKADPKKFLEKSEPYGSAEHLAEEYGITACPVH